MGSSRVRGSTLTVAAALAAVAATTWVAVTTSTPVNPFGAGTVAGAGAGERSLPTLKKRRAPTAPELRAAILRCGFHAKALAAAGVTPAETTTLVGNARQYLTDHPDDLQTADQSLFAAQSTFDRLLLKVQQGQATQDDLNGYAAMQTTLSSASSTRDAAVSALQTATTANLAQGKQDTLSTLRANAHWKLPVQYIVVNRDEPQWVTLRDALTNDRQARAQGIEPDPTLHQALLDADSVPGTSAAAQSLAASLADVTNAFNTAVNGG